jgi:hypothetical protein
LFGIYLNFLQQKFSAHQDLSNNTKGTFQFLRNFQLRFTLIFSEEIIQYSRTFALRVVLALRVQTSWNQAHAPLLVKELSKDTKNTIWSIRFGGSHNYNTKQNKLPSFIDRLEARFSHWHRNINHVPILLLQT